ncbi:MAG: peptide-methionine (S)-S-oxide reductase MsrA [Sneathiella sp.]|nr:peptide-methionine (S)-S-oxide reductase MsrA [Sneathiella sp.]
MANGSGVAFFGAGCFWGVEAAFRKVEGVTATTVGYQGGHKINPSYQDVCTGTTDHAEVVAVNFDPARVTYEELLSVFWQCHNPTTLNRQGPDVGTQYRSVIYYADNAQKEAAERSKQALTDAKAFRDPIVTAIEPAADFYPAEDYHQQYLEKRGLATCHI